MTVIVGLVQGRRVYVAADREYGGGHSRGFLPYPKIAKMGEYIIGAAGMTRFAQLVFGAKIKDPPKSGDVERHLVGSFSDTIIKSLERGKFPLQSQEHGEDAGTKSGLLIAVRGRLFEMGSDFCIVESSRGFAATGCGECSAMGSMVTSAMCGVTDPESRLRLAVGAAIELVAGCGGPVDILSI